MRKKKFIRPSMHRILARMSAEDHHEDWWERHHRLAARLFAAPIGPVTPIDPRRSALDGLCATLRRVKMPFGMPVNMGDYERFKGRGATLVYYPLYQLVERGLAELRARLGC